MPAAIPARRRRAAARLAGVLALAVALAACGGPGGGGAADPGGSGDPGDASGSGAGTTGSASPSASGDGSGDGSGDPDAADPDEPTGWGPTVGDLAAAQEQVASWSPARLAGQVVVGRYRGTDPAEAAAMVRRMHLAGLSVTSDNVVDEGQVRAVTRAVARAARRDGRSLPPVVGVDQEGGVVEQLRGVATTFPSYATAGAAVAADPAAGRPVVRRAAEATALELRDLGFTWDFAPVADVTIGAADPTIGSRSPSTDPRVVARTVTASVDGFARAGVVATVKHFPGHGAVTADSHLTLPVQEAPLGELRSRDLVPFRAAVRAGAPAVMMSHVAVQALAPGVPASLAPPVYDLLREDLGFEGVVITDSLGMGAVVGRTTPAVRALEAGADLLLMPADTERAHATLTAGIRSGQVSRERAEEAAARVLALQTWQQRAAGRRPVPDDVSARAQQAAAALAAAG